MTINSLIRSFKILLLPLSSTAIDCGSPLYISEQVNGEFVPLLANRTTYGSMAKLRCFDAQSVYSSEHVLITCGSDGQWSAPKAICVSGRRPLCCSDFNYRFLIRQLLLNSTDHEGFSKKKPQLFGF